MINETTYTKIDEYFALLLPHQKELNKNLVMTYDRGYWWCTSSSVINAYEKEFLNTGKNTDEIILSLYDADNSLRKSQLLHLLGWAEDTKLVGPILETYAQSKKHECANAALRALFPLVVTGKYKINALHINKLLYERSLLVKNKILGMLAFIPDGTLKTILTQNDIKHIRNLTKHRKMIVSAPAKMVIERL